MMKFTATVMLTVASFAARAQSADELRVLLRAATENSSGHEALRTATANISESAEPLLVGFKAMSELLACRNVFSPIKKLEHFKRGKSLLESAVNRAPDNAELRFMRLCTQLNTPAMLGYKNQIENDKKFLTSYLMRRAEAGLPDAQQEKAIKTVLDSLNAEAADRHKNVQK